MIEFVASVLYLFFSVSGIWFYGVYVLKVILKFSFFEQSQDYLIGVLFRKSTPSLSNDRYFLIECQNYLKKAIGESCYKKLEDYVEMGGSIIYFDDFSSTKAVWINCGVLNDEKQKLLIHDVFVGILGRYLTYHKIDSKIRASWQDNTYGASVIVLQYAVTEEEKDVLSDLLEQDAKDIFNDADIPLFDAEIERG